jgi:photosystem II stability/assembly factor-like uncharacterized protein
MNPEDKRHIRAALDAEYPRPHPALVYHVLPPRIERHQRHRFGGAAVMAALVVAVAVAATVFVAHREAGRSTAHPATSRVTHPSAGPPPASVPDPTVPATPSMFAPTWFVSPQIGWEATGGSLQKSTDGGVHWTAQLSLGYPKLFARDMRFLDAQTGFVMPLVTVSGHGASALYATTDGEHWVRRTVPATVNPAGGMDFVSATEGYVLLNTGTFLTPTVFHTVDGGNTWQQVAIAAPPGATPAPGQLPNNVHLEGMRFLDAADGWIAATRLAGQGSGGLPAATPSYLATTDGGHTWHEQVLPAPTGITYPAPSEYLEPPHFTDPLHGFGAFLTQQPPGATPGAGKFGSQAMAFYRTSDGGRTWAPSGVSPGGALTGAILNERDILVLVDIDAYVSRDQGATWLRLSALPSRGSWVDFANPRDGFAGDLGSSTLLITDDGGRTWRGA